MARQQKNNKHRYVWFDTSLGKCALSWSDRGITCLQLPEQNDGETLARLERCLQRHRTLEPLREESPPPHVVDAIEKLVRHLEGQGGDLSSIKLDFEALPPFHCKVYKAARKIPHGSVVSYGELARMAGSPAAARAVGQAMARNPFPLIVPCHRVMGSDGAAVGFSAFGGCDLKHKLLDMESVCVRSAAARDADPQEVHAAPRARRRAGTNSVAIEPPKKKPVMEAVPSAQIQSAAIQKLPAKRKQRYRFNANKAVEHICSSDKRMARLIKRVGDFRLELDEITTPFEALAEAIVYQQLTGKAAATIFSRVRALFGGELPIAQIIRTPDDVLRSAGLSRAKVLAFKDLAQKADEGLVPSLEDLESMTDEEIIERLTAIRGVGRWTVEMLLIFRLGRPDVLPVHDYGVRKGFALTFNGGDELPTPKELAAHGECWSPYRSVASWYLWRALELKAGK